MPPHLVAYHAANLITPDQEIAAIPDGVMPMRESRIAPSSSLFLVAAAAVAEGLQRARVFTDRMRPRGWSYVRPVNRLAMAPGLFPDDPGLQLFQGTPPRIGAGEEIRVQATGGNDFLCLLWLADRIRRPPRGLQAGWIRYTASELVTSNAWVSLSGYSLDSTLAAGRYVVLGHEYYGPSGQAARLVFEGQSARPGVMALSGADLGNRTHRAFYNAWFGVLGEFEGSSPPIIQVLCAAPQSVHEGYLRIARLE